MKGSEFEPGTPVPNWRPANRPGKSVLEGRYCRAEPLNNESHGRQLFEAYKQDHSESVWRYLPYGPFESLDDYLAWMDAACFNGDPMFYAAVDNRTGLALGVASYLRIKPDAGSIEVGHINYAPTMQNTRMSTEIMYLMMRNAFDLGYRRYEWKCDDLNQASKTAARRLGFTFEGVFRKMMVVKGRNRDTAWFSLLDDEWPAIKQAFEDWLDEDNFDANKTQKSALSDLTRSALDQLNQ